MNKKGFTLIETIMVVAILGLLAILLVPNVIGLINQNEEKNYEKLVQSIEKSTSLYISDNRYDLNLDCYNNESIEINVTLQTLIDKNYITSPVIDPRNNEEIDTGKIIKVTYDCNTKKFDYEFQE